MVYMVFISGHVTGVYFTEQKLFFTNVKRKYVSIQPNQSKGLSYESFKVINVSTSKQ